jgi:hypothetical protein
MPPSVLAGPSPSPSEAEDAAEGLVDITLIDDMLAMTILERLRHNDRVIRDIEKLRQGFAALAPSNDERTG